MTKKELLSIMAQHPRAKATVTGARTAEDWPAMVEEGLKQGWALDGNTLGLGKRFILKPVMPRVRIGTFVVVGRTYEFQWDGKSSSGSVTDLKIEDGALTLTMLNGGKIQYVPHT